MGIYSEIYEIVNDIQLPENYKVYIGVDWTDDSQFHRWYLQIHCLRPDTFTGRMGLGKGGKAYLSPHMVKSEVVQTAFGLYKGYFEHEARESFLYKGRRIYGPHIDVDALWDAAETLDVRKAPSA